MTQLIQLYNTFFKQLSRYSEDVFLLFMRLYVADAFLRSGWIKFNGWETTLYLFENEYQVPFLPFEFAAILATAAELVLPALLIIGLATRFSALALFVLNIIAVVSYPAIWAAGFWDHKLWGIMLLISVLFGAGKFSADAFLCRKCS